jgi:twitching motility two-component system response regulator PilG
MVGVGNSVKKKILIVEDEESLLSLESTLLVSKGYEVKGVVDGPSALESVASIKPDLILLDVMLPYMDGYQVCRQIKANEATCYIPVVMLSAKKREEDLVKAEQAGADWYIIKPFKSKMLIETIQRFLS